MGLTRAVERGGVKKALAKSKFDASDIVVVAAAIAAAVAGILVIGVGGGLIAPMQKR